MLPIGGVKEKLLAAHRAGIKNIVLPKDNEKDLADIPKNVLDTLNVYMVQTMDEVLKIALAEPLVSRLGTAEAAAPVETSRTTRLPTEDVAAEFVETCAAARTVTDLAARRRSPEIALVGRSNVGKSTLINALVRQRVARTSAAPGKTRLANIYRIARGGADPFYLVDLPGFGYARGGAASAREFEELTRAFFGREGHQRAPARRCAPSRLGERPRGLALVATHSRACRDCRDKNRQAHARRTDPRAEGIRIRV